MLVVKCYGKFVGNMLRFCLVVDSNLQKRLNVSVDSYWFYLNLGCSVVSFTSCRDSNSIKIWSSFLPKNWICLNMVFLIGSWAQGNNIWMLLFCHCLTMWFYKREITSLCPVFQYEKIDALWSQIHFHKATGNRWKCHISINILFQVQCSFVFMH